MRVRRVHEFRTEIYPLDDDTFHVIAVYHRRKKLNGETSPATVNFPSFSCDTPEQAAQFAAGIIYAAGMAAQMNREAEDKSEAVPA